MTTPTDDHPQQAPGARAPRARRAVLLRLDPAVHDALQRWAADDLRSLNAQVELLLRHALAAAGRAPRDAGPLPRRGRPPADRPRQSDSADQPQQGDPADQPRQGDPRGPASAG